MSGGGPGAAADHPLIAVADCSGPTICGVADIAIVPAVLRPFKNVAVHLIQAPGVRLEAIDGEGPADLAVRYLFLAHLVDDEDVADELKEKASDLMRPSRRNRGYEASAGHWQPPL
jgi:hypothetical protein